LGNIGKKDKIIFTIKGHAHTNIPSSQLLKPPSVVIQLCQ